MSFTSDFFEHNRASLAKRLNGAAIVISAYTQTQRQNDMAFPFAQEANFWYLTGIEQADWLLIVDGLDNASWLVAPKRDEVNVLFNGELSFESAKLRSGVKKIVSWDEGMDVLRSLAKKHSIVYTVGKPAYSEHFEFTLNPSYVDTRKLLERNFSTVRDCNAELNSLRAIKRPGEITAIEKAVKLTCTTFDDVHAQFESYKSEYEIEAEFTYAFKRRDADHAYDPIVASGANATTLHYGENHAKLKKGQLVLIDIGATVDGYCADITRTYAYGSATKRQQQVYEAVRDAQKEIITMIKPLMPLSEYLLHVDDCMKDALMKLSLLKDKNDNETYRRYFPHAISHGLGIDTHDSLGAPRTFEPGMVLTVEPGIYIPEEKIGVRIEDDILVTDKGNRNLSAKLSTQAL